MKNIVKSFILLFISSCSYIDGFNIFTSGSSSTQVESVKVERLWSKSIGQSKNSKTGFLQPFLFEDTIYTIDTDGVVTATNVLNADKDWSYNLDMDVSSGLLFHNNIFYFGTPDGKLYGYHIDKISSGNSFKDAFDFTGVFETSALIPDTSIQLNSEIASAATGVDDLVFVKLDDGDTVAVNTLSSDVAWVYKGKNVPLSMKGSGSIAHNQSNIYVARDDGNIVSLTSDSGKLNWLISVSPRSGRNELESLRDMEMTPLVTSGEVFTGNYQGNLVSIDLFTGNIIWSNPMSVISNVSIDYDNLYVSDNSGKIYSIDRYDGTIKWKMSNPNNLISTQTYVYNDYLISFSIDGHIIILDKDTGKLLSFKKIIDSVEPQSSGYIIDKVLYIVSKDGRLNAIQIN